jgi:hypothetical protein
MLSGRPADSAHAPHSDTCQQGFRGPIMAKLLRYASRLWLLRGDLLIPTLILDRPGRLQLANRAVRDRAMRRPGNGSTGAGSSTPPARAGISMRARAMP